MSRWALPLLLALILSIGCSGREVVDSRPKIFVSIPPQRYFVERLAGDLVSVESLIPAGVGAEQYEPTMAQIQGLSQASIFLALGHPAFAMEESWIAKAKNFGQLQVVKCADRMNIIADDPHVWISPASLEPLVQVMSESLQRLLPTSRERIQHQTEKFLSDIKSEDLQFRSELAAHKGDSFLVYHPELGYVARDYGLVQLSVEHEGKELGPHGLGDLITRAKKLGLRVMLTQPQYASTTAPGLAREIGAEIVEIDPLAENWLENIRHIRKALLQAVSS